MGALIIWCKKLLCGFSRMLRCSASTTPTLEIARPIVGGKSTYLVHAFRPWCGRRCHGARQKGIHPTVSLLMNVPVPKVGFSSICASKQPHETQACERVSRSVRWPSVFGHLLSMFGSKTLQWFTGFGLLSHESTFLPCLTKPYESKDVFFGRHASEGRG